MSDIVKAIARAVHFISIGLICSFTTGLLLIDSKSAVPKWHRMWGHFGAIGAIVSGLVNWWFLRSFKPNADKKSFGTWTILIHSKLLLLLIFFTPIIGLFTSNDKAQNTMRIILIVTFMCTTPFARRLRESFNPSYVNSN